MKRTVDAVATSGGVRNEWSIVEGDSGIHTLGLNSGDGAGGQSIVIRGTRDELAATLGAALQALGAQRLLITWQPEFAVVQSEAPQPILQWGDKQPEWTATVGEDLAFIRAYRHVICTDCGAVLTPTSGGQWYGHLPSCTGKTLSASVACTECGTVAPRPHHDNCSETGPVVDEVSADKPPKQCGAVSQQNAFRDAIVCRRHKGHLGAHSNGEGASFTLAQR